MRILRPVILPATCVVSLRNAKFAQRRVLVKGMGSSGAATGEPSDKMAPLEKMEGPKISTGSKY